MRVYVKYSILLVLAVAMFSSSCSSKLRTNMFKFEDEGIVNFKDNYTIPYLPGYNYIEKDIELDKPTELIFGQFPKNVHFMRSNKYPIVIGFLTVDPPFYGNMKKMLNRKSVNFERLMQELYHDNVFKAEIEKSGNRVLRSFRLKSSKFETAVYRRFLLSHYHFDTQLLSYNLDVATSYYRANSSSRKVSAFIAFCITFPIVHKTAQEHFGQMLDNIKLGKLSDSERYL